jgi:hypothetical protein
VNFDERNATALNMTSRPRTLRKDSDILNPSIESTGIDEMSSEIGDESEWAFTSAVAGVPEQPGERQ